MGKTFCLLLFKQPADTDVFPVVAYFTKCFNRNLCSQGKQTTAVNVAFVPALFLTIEECCTHFQFFLSLLFKCSDW